MRQSRLDALSAVRFAWERCTNGRMRNVSHRQCRSLTTQEAGLVRVEGILAAEHLYMCLAVLSAPLLDRHGEGWLPFVGYSEERCSLQQEAIWHVLMG